MIEDHGSEKAINRGFGMSNSAEGTRFNKFQGFGSQRLSCFTKIYRVIRLKNSIIIIRKHYPVCLQQYVPCIIKNKDIQKQFLRSLILALENLLKTLQKYQIEHKNLKLSNCYLKLNSSKLQIVVSDPHFEMMFEDPKPDCEAIADMVHILISGRPPIKIPDYKRMIHQSVKNGAYYQMI